MSGNMNAMHYGTILEFVLNRFIDTCYLSGFIFSVAGSAGTLFKDYDGFCLRDELGVEETSVFNSIHIFLLN